jgi:cytochrome P450
MSHASAQMKTLTVKLPDALYEHAERRAAERGETLAEYVVELVKDSNGQIVSEPRPDSTALLIALDKGRNQAPVGPLSRDELYDRNVLR